MGDSDRAATGSAPQIVRPTALTPASCYLRLEVVRVVRQDLAAAFGDEHEVLEAAAAVAVPVEPRLDRNHVARAELAGRAAEGRLLVNLEAHAVAERVVEAVLEHLARLLRAQGRVAVLLEDVAGDPVQLTAGDARLDRRDRAL